MKEENKLLLGVFNDVLERINDYEEKDVYFGQLSGISISYMLMFGDDENYRYMRECIDNIAL